MIPVAFKNLKLVLMRNKFPTYISEKTLKHHYAFTNAGVPAIWTPPRFGPPGPNPLADLDPPPRIWTPPTKLSENIILTSVLIKMDNTLRSSAY